MAIGISLRERIKLGNAFMVIADVTLDDDYPTGGEVINAKALGLNAVYSLRPNTAAGYTFEYVRSAKKLKAYSEADTEVVNKSKDLEDVVVEVVAIGV